MKLKVCGMRDPNNLEELVRIHPDYIGFIFYEKSKRNVAECPNVQVPESIKKVGVFVNESIEELVRKVNAFGLNAVQLHGDESPDYCEELLRVTTIQIELFKAFSVDKNFDFESTKDYEQFCDVFVFDTKGEQRGGTGKKFDWDLLSNYNGETPYLLSGGIGLHDAELIEEFKNTPASAKCIGVDVNSGFEIEPGLKKVQELKQFKEILP